MINTIERLRADIDSGRTADKVAASDPASAPLGADDEAAGKPSGIRAVRHAMLLENARPHEGPEHGGLGHAWILVVFTILFAAAIVIWGAAINTQVFRAGITAARSGVAILP